MGSIFSAPSRISHAASHTASCISQATQVFIHLMSGDTDLRAHNPASLGGTINSARMTLDSIRTKVDAIHIPQISFYAKIAGAVGAYTAIQSNLTQKRIASSLEGLAKDLSRYAEIKNNSYLAGNKGENNTNLNSQSLLTILDPISPGFPVQILDFANEVAEKRNSRFILAYYASNLPDPNIHNRLSHSNSKWRHLDRQTCFFQVFHDWTCLVAHIISIRRMPEYRNSEPICVLFPANCSSILNSIFCDIPATGGLDPDVVSFHGQVDTDGTPLTWLPAELAITGTPLYSFDNVFGLGFISTEKTPRSFLCIFVFALIAGCMLCLTLIVPDPEVKWFFFTCFLLCLFLSLMEFKEEEVVVRHKRPCDGVVRAAYKFQILETLMTI